jgi:hypothetical protein
VGVAEVRVNEAGIQMLGPGLRRQLFGAAPLPPVPPAVHAASRAALAQHGLASAHADVQPPIELPMLPPLQGGSVEAHFAHIGKEVARPYLGLAEALAGTPPPPLPSTWRIAPGWTRYAADCPSGTAVDVRAPHPAPLCIRAHTHTHTHTHIHTHTHMPAPDECLCMVFSLCAPMHVFA